MYLTELTTLIESAINTSPPENWGGGIVLPTDMPVLAGFDPFSALTVFDPGVFIVPGYNEVDLSKSRRTNRIDASTGQKFRSGVSKIKRISVIVVKPFEAKLDVTASINDVTHPSEWSLLSNLREDIEEFLIRLHINGVKLVDGCRNIQLRFKRLNNYDRNPLNL